MKITIHPDGKAYVKSVFPNLPLLKRSFDDLGKFSDVFTRSDAARQCSYLSPKQVDVTLELLLNCYNEDEYDYDLAMALYPHEHGLIILSHDSYKKITAEIYLQLELKPYPFIRP